MIVLLVVVLLVPAVLLGWFCWWLWRRGPYGRITAIVVAGGLAYFVGAAIFPPVSFYRDEFAYRTGVALPASAKFKFRKASYPDFHGDYAAEMLVEVSKEDFAWLERATKLNPATGAESIGGMYWHESEAAFGGKLEPMVFGSIRKRDSDERGAWALLKDGKTVYFWFVQT